MRDPALGADYPSRWDARCKVCRCIMHWALAFNVVHRYGVNHYMTTTVCGSWYCRARAEAKR